jgi:hypothetical protein
VTVPHDSLPTLTEVIAVVPDEATPSAPVPLAPDSVPLDVAPAVAPAAPAVIPRMHLWGEPDPAKVVDDVVARLQPTLEAWVRDRLHEGLQQALQDTVRQSVEAALARAVVAAVDDAVASAVRAGVEQAGADLARRLRAELPALARAAFESTRSDPFAR